MPRPLKQTVDYFPHMVSKGKTKLILQNEFGNDGYAFWYQLLELLCLTDNQVYDYNNPASWRLLLAETHVTEDNAIKILQLLADLRAIDPELHKAKIIWSQNLIDHLELVYRRRSTGMPAKPINVNKNSINVNKKPHTILNNTIQDNTIQDNTRNIAPKKEYGQFKNVLLTDDEYQKLEAKFNHHISELIEELSLGIESKGYKYKSHYAAIISWRRRADGKAGHKRELPTNYTPTPEYPD